LQPYTSHIVDSYEEKYRKGECIYSQRLTPTSIFQGIDLETKEKVILKELKKSKLVTNYMHDFARNELAIHYSLSNFTKCDNIVRVKEYFEDDKAYYLVMECSPDPNFFEDLLENVIIFKKINFKYLMSIKFGPIFCEKFVT
jgi:serine/threonine protein kinase